MSDHAGASSTAAARAPPITYERRRPENTTLYAVVRDNINTLYAADEAGFTGAPLPDFVRGELEGYLGCGLLARGFALLRCRDCGERRLVAFSCKGRGFCPSCFGRRMAQSAANLIERVIPEGVPLRQWVLTLPHSLRYRLAYDGALLGAVCRIFVDSVLGWYRRRLEREGARGGMSGAVTVIQRVASDLRLHPHFHGVFLDGVYTEHEGGRLKFHALPRLDTTEVGDVLQVVRARIASYLERRGVVEDNEGLTVLDDEFAEREPALAQLARAAVTGLAPAGPELRRGREPIALRGRPGVEIVRPLCAEELGFNLHAATRAGGKDNAGREGLLRYVLRPPIATERVQTGPEGLVRLALKRPFKDGTVAIDLDPLSLLCRLCASVPSPKLHTVRYGGVLGAHAKYRSRIVPQADHEQSAQEPEPSEPDSAPVGHSGSRYWPWAQLLARTFGIDVEQCPSCGGRLRLVALVTEAGRIRRILERQGEPTDPPRRAPARGPPYFSNLAVRRKPAAVDQRELFE